jgi:undecaprenyl diphosphate synthase
MTKTPSPPRHVAIVMDGNGRWATSKGLSRLAGHQAGVQTVEQVINGALEAKVSVLTLFGFSTENWTRPAEEINALMDLLRWYIKAKTTTMVEQGIALKTIGDLTRLPQDIQHLLHDTKEKTQHGTILTVVLALNYGGRQEIAKTLELLVQQGHKTITEDDITKNLQTHPWPDPDLLIRTSGEQRISNFLLWQLAYTELWFTSIPWPAFTKDDFLKAIEDYGKRHRRFGSIG